MRIWLLVLVLSCAACPPPRPPAVAVVSRPLAADAGARTNAPSAAANAAFDLPIPAGAAGEPRAPRSLSTVKGAYAQWLTRVHQRVHPIFTDAGLEELSALPPLDPRNRPDLKTRVEIVVEADGRVARVDVTARSGVDEFDALVTESIQAAGPFAPVPAEILSADRRVHVLWELRRNPTFACSLYNTRPLLLEY